MTATRAAPRTGSASASSSRWRGIRSPGSSATSASTRRSTSTTARSSSARARRRCSAATACSCAARIRATPHFITSRICGICGDNHATCSVYAQNMAYGIKMPPLAEWIYNLGEAAEYMFDHSIFQDNLVFVDFCEQMVKETNPACSPRPRRTAAPNAAIHGYRTIADIMRAFNPFTGDVYREALADEPPHARDVLPDGGAPRPPVDALSRAAPARSPTPQVFTDYLVAADQVHRLRQEARAAQRRHLRLLLRGAARLRGGRRSPHPARLLGLVPGPRGRRLPLRDDDRLGPGDVRDARHRRRRQAVTTDLVDINLGIRILLGSSYYDDWAERGDVRHARIRSATRSTSATRGTRPRSPSRRSATSRAATTAG